MMSSIFSDWLLASEKPGHIIKNLKFHYRKLLLRKYLAAIVAQKDLGVSTLDAWHLLRAAWGLVTSARWI
jgi:hypothetical protein